MKDLALPDRTMQIGIVGLGRMGTGLARRLLRAGHEVVVYNRSPDKVRELESDGAVGCLSLGQFATSLRVPRVAWVMLPAGATTRDVIRDLATLLEPDDVLVDGGNSHYADAVRHAALLGGKGIRFLDCGTSGGIHGLERGYCLMIGGDPESVARLDPIFRSLAPGVATAAPTPGRELPGRTADSGYLHCGPAGAGHFVKMIHNGIEYGIMQAYAEGFDIMVAAGSESREPELRYELPLDQIAEVWRRGSVVASWLLDLLADALAKSPQLSEYSGRVDDSGEARWAIESALDAGVPCPALTASLFARFRTRISHSYGDKLLSAMRHQFGGHTEPRNSR